jgi:hypothetical protein
MWAGLASIAGIVTIVRARRCRACRRARPGTARGLQRSGRRRTKSRHICGDAADVWLNQITAANREKLRMGFARYIVAHYKTSGLGFGFGVYTNDIHIDIGRKAGTIVTWEQGKKFIDKAKAELGVA